MKMLFDKYPVGTKVRLNGDNTDDEPREVIGYMQLKGFNYLLFKDGYMAIAGNVKEKLAV